MAKKRSAKQRAASLANLRKARRKRAGAAAPKRRRHKRARAAAPKKIRRRRARAVAAAPKRRRRRARRHARSVAAAPKRRTRRRRRQARDNYQDWTTASVAGRNSALVKHGGRKVKRKRKSRRKGRRTTSRTSTHKRRRSPRKRYFRKVRGTNRRRVIRSRSRRHRVKGYTIKRGKRAGKRVKHHYSYEAGAMENPLSTGEVVVVGIIGVLGGIVAQGADRFLATHALTGTIAADGSGLTDAPAKGQDYNLQSVAAPMSLVRWAVAAGLSLVPIVGAHYVKSPMARTSMQAFGFGALIRTGIKGASDLTGWMLRKNAMGQRLFAPEIQAHANEKQFAADYKADPNLVLPASPALPNVASVAMLAGVPQGRKGVAGCTDCGDKPTFAAPPPPPPPAYAPPISQVQAGVAAPPPAAPPAAPPAPAPAVHTNGSNYSGRFFSPNLPR